MHLLSHLPSVPAGNGDTVDRELVGKEDKGVVGAVVLELVDVLLDGEVLEEVALAGEAVEESWSARSTLTIYRVQNIKQGFAIVFRLILRNCDIMRGRCCDAKCIYYHTYHPC